MTTSHWLRPHSFKTPDSSTDLLIVGGGYVGLSTAYWITELRPDLRVTVIDRMSCGAGASGRNAGFLTMGSASFYKGLSTKWGDDRAREIFHFAAESLELVYQHILKVSPEIKFERTSSMTLFRSEEQLSEWNKSGFKPENFNFNWSEGSSLPVPLQSKFFGSLEASPEYKVNPVQLLSSLKGLLESRKVQFIENSSAFELHPEGVMTELNFIKAHQVILALNGYFPQFHTAFKGAITPRRAQMLAVEFDGDFECPSLYYDPPERVYWRKTQDKILVIGGKRLLDEEGETGDFEKISPKIQRGLEEYLRDYLCLNYRVINRWSGTMGFTEHELPLVGKINAPLETYVIGGFSGHGMGLGFRSGLDMAQLVLGLSKESFYAKFKEPSFNL
jgi:glycine/D-amino acid oxidase-like deaminating enzyme